MMDQSHPDELSKLESLYAERPEGRVFTHLAEAYRAAGELELAREVVAAGLEHHGDYPSAHVVHGRVLMDVGRPEEAEAAFRRVLELDRHNLAALRGLGDLARREGHPDVALRHYRELLELDADAAVEAAVEELEAGGAVAAGAPEGAVDASANGAGRMDDFDLTVGDAAAEADDAADSPGREFAFDDPFADADAPADDAVDDAEFGFVDGFQTMDRPSPEPEDDASVEAEAYRGLGTGEAVETGGAGGVDGLEGDAAGTAPDAAPRGGAAADDSPVDAADRAVPAGAAADANAASGDDIGEEGADDLPLLLDPTAEDEDAGADAGARVEDAEHGEPAAGHEGPPAGADDGEPYDATEVPSAGGLVTATMAELYARQGLYDRAVEVYRDLLARRPDDEELRARLADVEARAREAAPEATRPDREAPEEATEPDWAAIEALAEELAGGHVARRSGAAGPSGEEGGGATEEAAEPQAVEAAWTAGAGVAGGEVTPYSWAEEPGAGAGESGRGPTLRDYFRTLLGWAGPSSGESPSARAGPIDLEDELPDDEFDRLFEGDGEPGAAGQAARPPEPAGDAAPGVADAAEAADSAGPAGPESAAPGGGGGSGGPAPSPGDAGAEEDGDDEDLEAFRAWLESLKR